MYSNKKYYKLLIKNKEERNVKKITSSTTPHFTSDFLTMFEFFFFF